MGKGNGCFGRVAEGKDSMMIFGWGSVFRFPEAARLVMRYAVAAHAGGGNQEIQFPRVMKARAAT